MKDRRLFKIGAIIAGLAGTLVLAEGVRVLVTRGDALGWLGFGTGLINTALLLRVMRWEIND